MMRTAAFVVCLAAAVAVDLVSVHQEDGEAAAVCNSNQWWAHVGKRVFFAQQPAQPTVMLEMQQGHASDSHLGSRAGLSSNSSQYYYAMGSIEALTPEMKQNRVGGEGPVHIFFLPEGPSSMPVSSSGDRRSSLSSLVQLQRGDVVMAGGEFPAFNPSGLSPLPIAQQNLMREAANELTQEMYANHLKKVVSIGDGTMSTRSSSNPVAESKAHQTLKGMLEEFKTESKHPTFRVCMQEFEHTSGSKLANIIGFLPGSKKDAGTVTFGAHFDSRPFKDEPAPGANDNGSGVSALLSTVKVLLNKEYKPEKNVLFTLFDGEEIGLVGSNYFHKALQSPLDTLSECVGQPSEASFLQDARRSYKSWSNVENHQAIIADEIGWRGQKEVDAGMAALAEVAFVEEDEEEQPAKKMAAGASKQPVPKASTPSKGKHVIVLESHDTDQAKRLNAALFQSNQVVNEDEENPLGIQHSSNPFGSDHMSWESANRATLAINPNDGAYPNYHKSTDTIENVDIEYATKVSKMLMGGLVATAGVANGGDVTAEGTVGANGIKATASATAAAAA